MIKVDLSRRDFFKLSGAFGLGALLASTEFTRALATGLTQGQDLQRRMSSFQYVGPESGKSRVFAEHSEIASKISSRELRLAGNLTVESNPISGGWSFNIPDMDPDNKVIVYQMAVENVGAGSSAGQPFAGEATATKIRVPDFKNPQEFMWIDVRTNPSQGIVRTTDIKMTGWNNARVLGEFKKPRIIQLSDINNGGALREGQVYVFGLSGGQTSAFGWQTWMTPNFNDLTPDVQVRTKIPLSF